MISRPLRNMQIVSSFVAMVGLVGGVHNVPKLVVNYVNICNTWMAPLWPDGTLAEASLEQAGACRAQTYFLLLQ